MTDLSLPPSGRTTRIPQAALRHYGAGANPRPATLVIHTHRPDFKVCEVGSHLSAHAGVAC
jgi:hypothetical protein